MDFCIYNVYKHMLNVNEKQRFFGANVGMVKIDNNFNTKCKWSIVIECERK